MRLLSQAWLALGLLIVTPLASAEDFGVANWGQNAMAVRDLEQRPNLTPLTERDYLIYEASLPGIHRTRLIYQFEDGRLETGRFIFSVVPGSPTSTWLDQFETVRALITQQYGEPAQQQVLQPAGSANNPPDNWSGTGRGHSENPVANKPDVDYPATRLEWKPPPPSDHLPPSQWCRPV